MRSSIAMKVSNNFFIFSYHKIMCILYMCLFILICTIYCSYIIWREVFMHARASLLAVTFTLFHRSSPVRTALGTSGEGRKLNTVLKQFCKYYAGA